MKDMWTNVWFCKSFPAITSSITYVFPCPEHRKGTGQGDTQVLSLCTVSPCPVLPFRVQESVQFPEHRNGAKMYGGGCRLDILSVTHLGIMDIIVITLGDKKLSQNQQWLCRSQNVLEFRQQMSMDDEVPVNNSSLKFCGEIAKEA